MLQAMIQRVTADQPVIKKSQMDAIEKNNRKIQQQLL